jgi:uncharacterized protein YacL
MIIIIIIVIIIINLFLCNLKLNIFQNKTQNLIKFFFKKNSYSSKVNTKKLYLITNNQ